MSSLEERRRKERERQEQLLRQLNAQSLTGMQAYSVMRHFIARIYHRLESDDLAQLLSETALADDGLSVDPACLFEWAESMDAISRGEKVL